MHKDNAFSMENLNNNETTIDTFRNENIIHMTFHLANKQINVMLPLGELEQP